MPGSLIEAVEKFAADGFSKQVLGPSMYRAWLDYKREEWASYTHHVSDWEYDRYLKFF